jgi:hypothetical protein
MDDDAGLSHHSFVRREYAQVRKLPSTGTDVDGCGLLWLRSVTGSDTFRLYPELLSL